MKNRSIITATLGILITGCANSAPTETDLARAFCNHLDGTGEFSAPCDVSYPDITIAGDFRERESAKICNTLSTYLGELGLSTNWRVRLETPYTTNSLAYCRVKK